MDISKMTDAEILLLAAKVETWSPFAGGLLSVTAEEREELLARAAGLRSVDQGDQEGVDGA